MPRMAHFKVEKVRSSRPLTELLDNVIKCN